MQLSFKLLVIVLVVSLAGCNHFTYNPHSKKKTQREKPSVVLLNRIIEFREEFNSWPFSREEFTGKGLKYRQAFDGFPYLETKFRVVDNNTMIFSFWRHIRDEQNYQQTNKVDLNSYAGEVKFFKEKDKFIWKLKMK